MNYSGTVWPKRVALSDRNTQFIINSLIWRMKRDIFLGNSHQFITGLHATISNVKKVAMWIIVIQYPGEIGEVVVFANINQPNTQTLNLREFYNGGIQANIIHGKRIFFIIRKYPSKDLNSILAKVAKDYRSIIQRCKNTKINENIEDEKDYIDKKTDLREWEMKKPYSFIRGLFS